MQEVRGTLRQSRWGKGKFLFSGVVNRYRPKFQWKELGGSRRFVIEMSDLNGCERNSSKGLKWVRRERRKEKG